MPSLAKGSEKVREFVLNLEGILPSIHPQCRGTCGAAALLSS